MRNCSRQTLVPNVEPLAARFLTSAQQEPGLSINQVRKRCIAFHETSIVPIVLKNSRHHSKQQSGVSSRSIGIHSWHFPAVVE